MILEDILHTPPGSGGDVYPSMYTCTSLSPQTSSPATPEWLVLGIENRSIQIINEASMTYTVTV